MNPFPWHPVDLGLKLALARHSWFDPVLEWCTPPSDFSHGTYFGLARRGDAGDRCGYLATQDFHGEFRECEFPLEELEELEKTLKATVSSSVLLRRETTPRGSDMQRIQGELCEKAGVDPSKIKY